MSTGLELVEEVLEMLREERDSGRETAKRLEYAGYDVSHYAYHITDGVDLAIELIEMFIAKQEKGGAS